MFGVETNHVAPWKSSYKILFLSDTEAIFLRTSGGLIAGITSEPGDPRRHCRVSNRCESVPFVAPDVWHAAAPQKDDFW